MKYKYSELEKDIQDVMSSDRVDKYYLYSQMIDEITDNDETASRLANKVIANDVSNLLEKIQSIYQRSDADCKSTEDRSDIDVLIAWLEHIRED